MKLEGKKIYKKVSSGLIYYHHSYRYWKIDFKHKKVFYWNKLKNIKNLKDKKLYTKMERSLRGWIRKGKIVLKKKDGRMKNEFRRDKSGSETVPVGYKGLVKDYDAFKFFRYNGDGK